MNEVWPDSAIVEVTLDRGNAATEVTATPRDGV